MSKDIEMPEMPERTDEVIIKGNDIGSINTSIKCGPCMNGRHNDCNLENCEYRMNNHKIPL